MCTRIWYDNLDNTYFKIIPRDILYSEIIPLIPIYIKVKKWVLVFMVKCIMCGYYINVANYDICICDKCQIVFFISPWSRRIPFIRHIKYLGHYNTYQMTIYKHYITCNQAQSLMIIPESMLIRDPSRLSTIYMPPYHILVI